MYVHRSNRAEALVDVLAEIVTPPLPDPTAAECIVVQGRGMERWLSMELARRLGVWANPDFPFPRHLILRTLADLLGLDVAAPSPFEPEILRWSVADLLGRFLTRPEFVEIRTYLAGDDRGIRRVQLAHRIADTFDQYVVYRPEMVLEWERGGDTHWQALLWRALVERHGATHMAARARAFLDAMRRSAPPLRTTPARICVFGVSTLAPLYLQMLAALAQHRDVHLLLLSPSAEYWADIRSRRETLRAPARQPAGADDVDQALHLAEGNPLLASLGRIGRDFQLVLEANVDYHEGERNLYTDPGTRTMLSALQSDILALRHRRPGNADALPLALDPGDDSIAMHVCHAPMREVEVLHDQLLALFDRDASLEPRDVVVMSPRIDAYAPFIDAVFGGAAEHQPRIPYRIADRAVRATDDAVAAFLAVLATLRGRMTASAVLDLLGMDPVRERFGFVSGDLEVVRRWIQESGIRWGIDAVHREQAEQPPLLQNTWRFGLDRLLLGYAMPGAGRHVYGGVLPYDDVEGSVAEVLGRFVEFCEALFSFQRSLQAARAVDAWRADLGRLLRAMIGSTNQTAHQHRQIHAALEELAAQARAGGFHDPVDLDTMQLQLAGALERAAPGRGFLTGGVTFCALVPMRSIPFRVVCLLGMNDADFPRVRRPPGFDLVAQRPRPGDRSSRDDDRYLFLEALLSSRERLIITFVGQSVRDNGEIPPSVVVSELLDVIEDSFVLPAAGAQPPAAPTVRAHLVTRHPLQPFSPRYFGADPDPRLFSYARSHCEGARALRGHRSTVPPFVSVPLPLDPATAREVSIDALARFFENPARGFLHQRLSLYLGSDMESVDDREPLELDNLERWKVGTSLLERQLDGEGSAEALPSLRASGVLPPGALGTCVVDGVEPEVRAIALVTQRLHGGTELEPLVVDERLDGTRVTGVLRDLWPAGQVRYQFSKLGGRHEIGLWIRHLVLNWLRAGAYPRVSYLAGRPAVKDGPTAVRFRPVDDAGAILRELLGLYWLGQTMPLLLFERASRVYTAQLRERPRAAVAALKKAQAAFDGGFRSIGDRDNEYVRQVFGTANPLDPGFTFDGGAAGATAGGSGFARLAVAVFGPLLDHREELS
jgi:exodeoxyribonuclease V gamma subunit